MIFFFFTLPHSLIYDNDVNFDYGDDFQWFPMMAMRKCNCAKKTGARFDLWARKAALLFHNRPDIQSGKGQFTNTKIYNTNAIIHNKYLISATRQVGMKQYEMKWFSKRNLYDLGEGFLWSVTQVWKVEKVWINLNYLNHFNRFKSS